MSHSTIGDKKASIASYLAGSDHMNGLKNGQNVVYRTIDQN